MSAAVASKYRPHPVALIFPMMGTDDLAGLARDIAENGLREPITVMGDVILDGRNRLAACEMADVEPVFREWKPRDKDDTPDAWIISHNLHRRHLTESQRAMAASDYADHIRKQRRSAQTTESTADGERKFAPEGKASVAAAEAFNVSTRSVEAADRVKRDGAPALVSEVRKGNVPVSSAAKVTKEPKADQAKAAAKGKRAVTALAKKVEREKPEPVAADPLDTKKAAKVAKEWKAVATALRSLDVAMRKAGILRDKGEPCDAAHVEQVARMSRAYIKDPAMFAVMCRVVATAMGRVADGTERAYRK